MTKEKHTEVTIHLNNIHDLFVQPVIDPFSQKAPGISGIEFIKSELASTAWGHRQSRGPLSFFQRHASSLA
jgi:hypothetical protein